jgi:hypothetical protein
MTKWLKLIEIYGEAAKFAYEANRGYMSGSVMYSQRESISVMKISMRHRYNGSASEGNCTLPVIKRLM